MSKDFMTYNQQMRLLRNAKGIECNGATDKIILAKTGYFNLVNGYKKPFINGTTANNNHSYIKGTTLTEMYELKCFDDKLRMLFLKYLTHIEEEVRTIVGYKFDEINDRGKKQWFEIDAYGSEYAGTEIMKVISKSFQEIQRSKQSYVQHYLEEHKKIPTWILVKVINFSSFINLLSFSKNKVKDSVCNLYTIKHSNGDNDYKMLKSSLNWFRKIRNSCAHNERIYDICNNDARIKRGYFYLLPKSYRRTDNQMIIDLIMYMKYYLSQDEYDKLIDSCYTLLKELENEISYNAFQKVRADMGIKDIEHLKLLKKDSKKIVYNRI